MITKKKNREFIYNAFFRPNPPSILRLACIQLIREGVDFTNKETWEQTWNLIWDRATFIIKQIRLNKEVKKLHEKVMNERTF